MSIVHQAKESQTNIEVGGLGPQEGFSYDVRGISIQWMEFQVAMGEEVQYQYK